MKMILCPFHKRTSAKMRHVLCEAGKIDFPHMEQGASYIAMYCSGEWKSCTLARMLLQYYDGRNDPS